LFLITSGRKGCVGGKVVGEEDIGGGVGIRVEEGGGAEVNHELSDLVIAL